MLKDFSFWLEGIEEETPLPYEIKHIYFCLHRSNNYFYISYGGNQFDSEMLFNFEYHPLEAQFFEIYCYDKFFNLNKLENLVEDLFDNVFFRNLFANKFVYVAVFGTNEIFKINK
ncbi:MAG: hypothetical protein PHX09_03720 [Clostridia bacterium]|nr:hypothetical protein [Clostridia bacterium]MDD4686373.1 hypothetical protein [Clostridia bacterium]